MAEKVHGSFSFSILDDADNVYLVKGDSPLSILHFPKQKIYVYASTEEILYRALGQLAAFLKLLKITSLKKLKSQTAKYLKSAPTAGLKR